MLPVFVLIACEESQTECTEFRKLGALAYSCDLQTCSGHHPEWHIVGDCLPLLTDNPHNFVTEDGQPHNVPGWDLIIAHPPCTYLTTAGCAYLYPQKGQIDPVRLAKGHEAAQFFKEFLKVQYCPVAVENPRPFPYFGLPKYSDITSPHKFGSKYSKRTYLWLHDLPPLLPTLINPHPKSYVYTVKGGKARSKSFPELAKAMAEQWLPLIKPRHPDFGMENGGTVVPP